MFFKIYMTVACIVAAIIIYVMIVRKKYDFLNNRIPIGDFIIAIAVTQVYPVFAASMWWQEWWISHRWIMLTSAWISIGGLAIYGIIEFIRRIR